MNTKVNRMSTNLVGAGLESFTNQKESTASNEVHTSPFTAQHQASKPVVVTAETATGIKEKPAAPEETKGPPVVAKNDPQSVDILKSHSS